MLAYLRSHPAILYIAAVLLLLPALLIRLGHVNIFLGVDEATRAVVALEMMYSGNYIVPTINGELYLNKPPLYNWILAAFYSLFQSTNMLVMRLPNVLALLGFAYVIYRSTRPYFTNQQAIVLGLMVVTAARILVWESLFGYIDILFSAVLYASFMLIFYLGERRRYLAMFAISYALTAVAYMLKGVPAIAFQGITLLAYLIWRNQWKQLFRWPHFLGVLAFLLPLALYYGLYAQQYDLVALAERLWTESSQRTASSNGFVKVATHIVAFPFEMLYHYLPWSLMLLFCFRRGFWLELKAQPFIFYCFLVFILNIPLYWTSPQVYPKYILMLVPLIYTVGYYFYVNTKQNSLHEIFRGLLLILCMAIPLGCILIPLFIPTTQSSDIYYAILLFPLMCLVAYLSLRLPAHRIILAMLSLLLFRILFVVYVWSPRNDKLVQHKENTVRIAERTQGHSLFYYNMMPVQHGHTFYLMDSKQETIFQANDFSNADAYYIVPEVLVDDVPSRFERVDSIPYVENGAMWCLYKRQE